MSQYGQPPAARAAAAREDGTGPACDPHADPAMAFDRPTGMAEALMHEIAEAMQGLAADGAPRTVTLRGLPIGPADYRVLRDRLGTGEVEAVVTCEGRVEISETRYHGVWWVRAHDRDGTITSEHVEVARVPMLLEADPADIAADAAALAATFGPNHARTASAGEMT